VSVDVRMDLSKVRAAVKDAPKKMRAQYPAAFREAGTALRDEARERIHSPGGHARSGIRYLVSGTADDTRVKIGPGRGRAGQAAVFAQRSRGPGRTPPSMKAARRIARQYGLPDAAARPIALAIAARGTRGRPVMGATLRATRSKVAQIFRDTVWKPVAKAITQ
jgi:hypothetical protein